MPKERDWIDYASLAAQVSQNIQLSGLQQKLSAIGRLAVERDLREQREAQTRLCEELAREVIFQTGRSMKALREYLPTEPRGAMAAALGIKHLFELNGVTTALLTAFEDKERLQALFDDLKGFTAECRSPLNQQDQETVERCAAYQAEEGDLNELIQWLRNEEEVEATRGEVEAKSWRLDELKKASHRRPGFDLLCVLPGSVIILIGFSFVRSGDPGFLLFGIIGIGLVFVGLIVGAIIQATPAQRQLEEEIKSLESELERPAPKLIGTYSANLESILREAERVERLQQKFGKDLNSAEFTKILEDRKAFIKEVMEAEQAKDHT